jgi:hypothetical protein
MSNPYWLNPAATSEGPSSRTMAHVTVPPVREHTNNYFLSWPLIPKQQNAVENFVVREDTRQYRHTRQ